ncbi:MAG TPA: hypothetical protein VJ327_11030 [Patescibacteria group bacterium]|nr:hypothetical protein [Patescibacteria group bacterium]
MLNIDILWVSYYLQKQGAANKILDSFERIKRFVEETQKTPTNKRSAAPKTSPKPAKRRLRAT